MSPLFDTLEELGATTNANICYLNLGGCGIFAYLVASALQQKGIAAEIAIPNKGDIGELKSAIQEKKLREMARWNTHIAIRIYLQGKSYIYDSDGVVMEKPWDGWHPESISCEELRKMIRHRCLWNACFDRRQVPKLKKLVQEVLEIEE